MTEQQFDQRPVDFDFDHFQAVHAPAEQRQTVRIMGRVVAVPVDMPGSALRRDVGSTDAPNMAAMLDMLGDLYSPGDVDAWLEAGMGMQAIARLFAWSLLRAQGEQVSFDDAEARVTEAMRDHQAKTDASTARNGHLSAAAGAVTGAPTDAQRRHEEAVRDAGKAPSSASGAPSRPTSGGSTAYGPSSLPTWEPGSSGSFWATSPGTPSTGSSFADNLG